MIQSVHNFAHATTAELSWHVQNCERIGPSFFSEGQVVFIQDLDWELMNRLWNGCLVQPEGTRERDTFDLDRCLGGEHQPPGVV